MLILFVLKNMAALALLLAVAAGAGTLVVGTNEGIGFRGAVGLALCAHACFVLAAIGQLRPVPILILTLVLIAATIRRARGAFGMKPAPSPLIAVFALGAGLLFALALYPPLAFDETLYHLPFVHAFVRDGALRFLADLRMPVFPVLHELLCVPMYFLAGDAGAHLVSLAKTIVLTLLLVEWGSRYHPRAGWLAAALFLGSPLVIQLATVLYVEIALTLFITAGFYAVSRERPALAGFLLGTACGVKYLGFYFAGAALVFVAMRAANRARSVALFLAAWVMTALPTTAWIVLTTGDPLFPFLRSSAWAFDPSPPAGFARMVRVIWDVTFARERVGLQPPITPFLAMIVLLVIAAAIRNAWARGLLALSAVYLLIFNFLPQDSRYLLPLLPLLTLAAAITVALRWPKATTWLAILSIAPGLAYAGYRLAKQGVPPATPSQRSAWLATHVPEYAALRHAGTERVYGCGAEQLKSHAGGQLLGDYNGPYSYARILGRADTTRAIAERLRAIDARYYLVAKRACSPPRANGAMELVYEDGNAQLWRVGE